MADEVDVLVVGGGPAGAAAAVFTARAGLDTRVYDRGPSSLRQCAHLSNYLGFPRGIDVETFDDLSDAHVRAAGGTVRKVCVEAINRREPAGFRVETETETVDAARVVAATPEATPYLDPIRDEIDVDRDAVDRDGRTAVPGLYVAGPLAGGPDQALVAAGHGARVGHAIAVAAREEGDHWAAIASEYYDWTPQESAFDPGWKERVDEWVRGTLPDDHDVPPEAVESVVDHEVEHERESALSSSEATERRRVAQFALLDHLDDDVIREYLDTSDGPGDGE